MSVYDKITVNKLNVKGSTSGSYLTQQSHASTTAYTITWPSTAGSNGNVLTTNGSGTLSWATSSYALNDLTDVTTSGTSGDLLVITNTTFQVGTSSLASFYANNDVTCDLGDATHKFKNLLHQSSLFYGATSGKVTMSAAATITDYTITWPAAAGTDNAILTKSAAGTISFSHALSDVTTIGMTGTLTTTAAAGDAFVASTSGAVLKLHTATLTGTGNNFATNGDLTVGTNLTVNGDLTVSGTTTTVSTTNLEVKDPLIHLANGNTADVTDIGFWGTYSTTSYAGLFRDASDSAKWKLFASVTNAPTSTVDVTGITYGSIVIAALECTTVTASSSISGTSVTASTGNIVATAGNFSATTNNASLTLGGAVFSGATGGLLSSSTSDLTLSKTAAVLTLQGATLTGGASLLTTGGALTVGGILTVSTGGASITGNSSVTGDLSVSGKTTIANEVQEVKAYSGAGAHVLGTDGKRLNIITHTTAATVTLPTAPTTGTVYTIINNITAGTTTVTINAGGSDKIDDGVATSFVLSVIYERVTLQYVSTTSTWYIV